jgi:hypothetical protein
MTEYVVIAVGPNRRAVGDHITPQREDAIDYAIQFLDEERRDGASVTITVVQSDDQQMDLLNAGPPRHGCFGQ